MKLLLFIMTILSSSLAFKFFIPRLFRHNTRNFSSIAENVQSLIKENDVMVFSKTYCPYCSKAKESLKNYGLNFKSIELDVEKDGAQIQNTLLEMTGQKTVPNIFIKGKHLGGCDKTLEAIKDGKLKQMLNS